MKARGGYILHIDGTCEEASRVLLVCMDSVSMQVLESRRIHSENHDEERFFRTVKRQCRRLHGREDLSHDLETMPPAVPLVMNLTNRDYCETVYGGSEPEQIADRFSQVDLEAPAKLLQSWRQENISHRMSRKIERQKNLPKRVAGFIAMAIKELRD